MPKQRLPLLRPADRDQRSFEPLDAAIVAVVIAITILAWIG